MSDTNVTSDARPKRSLRFQEEAGEDLAVNNLTDSKISPFIAYAIGLPAWMEPLIEVAQAWMEGTNDEAILGRMWEAAGLKGSPQLPLSVHRLRNLIRELGVNKDGYSTRKGMGHELRRWPAERRETLLVRLTGRPRVSVRLAYAHADPTVSFVSLALVTLNERFVSFGPGKRAVFVSVGDLVTGEGEEVTGIYSAESLEDLIRGHADLGLLLYKFVGANGKRGQSVLETWMVNSTNRRHYTGGFTFGSGEGAPNDVLRLTPSLDRAAAKIEVPVPGPRFAAAVAAKMDDVAGARGGAPTILLAKLDEANEVVDRLVEYFSRVFGPCFVGVGVSAPDPMSLVHVFPPAFAAETKRAQAKALSGGSTHVWRIVVLSPTPLYAIAPMVPPHLYSSSDLLVLDVGEEEDRTDDLRISALDNEARAVLELLAGGGWPGPGRIPASKIKLGLTGKNARSRTVDAICHYTGGSSPSPARHVLDLSDLAGAQNSFCAAVGVSTNIFSSDVE